MMSMPFKVYPLNYDVNSISSQGVQDCEGCEDIQCLGIIHYEGAPEENPKEDKVLDFDVVARDTGSLNRCEDDAEMNTKLAELNSTGIVDVK